MSVFHRIPREDNCGKTGQLAPPLATQTHAGVNPLDRHETFESSILRSCELTRGVLEGRDFERHSRIGPEGWPVLGCRWVARARSEPRALPPLGGGKGNGRGAEGVGPGHREQGNGQHGKRLGAKAITYWTAGEAAEEGEGDQDTGSKPGRGGD